MPKHKGKTLTAKQEMFCHEYLTDLNGYRAIVRAGYKGSYGQLRVQAHKLLQDERIQKRIEELNADRMKELKISAKEVLESICRVAEKAEENEDWNAALKGRELLGKHLRLFTDKVEHSGSITLSQLAKELSDEQET